MQILKLFPVFVAILMLAMSGCSGGGDKGNGVSPSIQANGASVNTTISASKAVCKITISNVATTICGFDANLNFPAGATFSSIVSSGVATGSLVSANPQGTNLKLALASGTGFAAGEVATVTFNVSGSVQPADFSIASVTQHNCP
jgi:hypothetical protein